MKPVVVRGVLIGEGMPKICVPIVEKNIEAILEEAKNIDKTVTDLVEWRADWFEQVFLPEKVIEVLKKLREILEDTPILFTFRSAAEGGEKMIDEKRYEELNRLAIQSGYVDLVDLELLRDGESADGILQLAHEHNVYVVGSNHNFQETPSEEDILERLQTMQKMGADILKIAVMPQNARDVITLLSATEKMANSRAMQPVVTMSMSGTGVVSRMAGEIFGSAITFGSAKKASAPGQIPAAELKRILQRIHESVSQMVVK